MIVAQLSLAESKSGPGQLLVGNDESEPLLFCAVPEAEEHRSVAGACAD